MSYQALYRKWRPSTFEDVKGQDHIVTTLKNQVKLDRVGHAYLFCGTRGTGKTTIAKIFAKAVNCENPVDGSPCGECATCRAIASGASMNVVEIDAASNNGVDNIRQIREEVAYRPTEGKKKVYIIDEVHMLSQGAYNAMLKTLEEPPEYVIFILATTEASRIPVTILSRCQRYDFHRITIDTITGRLRELMEYEKVSVEEKALKYIAKAADGSMRDALSLLDQCIAFYLGQELRYENVLEVLGAVDTTVFADTLRCIVNSDVPGCLHMVEEIIMQGRDLGQFAADFTWYLRNVLLASATKDPERLADFIDMSEENLALLSEASGLVDTDTLMRYIRVMSELSNELKTSTQKRVKLEVTFIKLCKPAMEEARDMSELAGRVTQLENQLDSAVKALKSTREELDRVKAGGLVPATVNTNNVPQAGAAAGGAVKKREVAVEALPEDVKRIAESWNDIVSTFEEAPLLLQELPKAIVTLAEDGRSLEIVMSSSTLRDMAIKYKQQLTDFIAERTGMDVNIIITGAASEDDARNRFQDIRELVSMPIETDDKEENI